MITVALPNKGRLSKKALTLFERGGLKAEFTSERALLAGLGPDFRAIFVRAEDVPEFVADGAADVGVTGADLVAESGREVETILDLGFGRCRLAVAVPDGSDVQELSQVPPGSRVATSFPNITNEFFDRAGIPIELVRVSGAAEIAPHLGVADMIVDLVSTGSTLQVNGLREVETVLTSTAQLIVSGAAWEDPARRPTIEDLAAALESVLRAERKRYLMANVPRDRVEELKQVLPGLSGPTIVEVQQGGDWVAAHAVVDEDLVFQTISNLKRLGAEGILVTRIERLMP